MTARDKETIGTRRRLLSTNFNDAERLTDRALLESLSALSLGDRYKLQAAGVGGVLGGLQVRAVSGTNEVEVLPGLALVAATPADTLFDPPLDWIELRSPTRVDLGPFVDGANPRLVTIEIEAQTVSKLNEPVAVFDPTTGGFGIANQDIVVGSDPVISVRAGAAGPSPQVAAGPGVAGQIPLAVVKLSTNQASFTDNFVSVLSRRPILDAGSDPGPMRGDVRGGGFSVGEVNGAVIGALGVAELSDVRLDMQGLVARGHGPAEFGGNNIRTPLGITVASLTGGTAKPLYGYAVPVPWAADYGPIAPSECVHENPLNVSLFATAESVILGDGFTFSSLAYTNGPANQQFTLRNMLVLFDTQAPSGITFGSSLGAQDAPPRVDDARGTHPDIVGTGSIDLEVVDPQSDATWGNSQSVTDAVYLGSVAAIGSPLTLMAQSYRGRGMVRGIDVAANTPEYSIAGATNIAGSIYPGKFPKMDIADNDIIPLYATRVEVTGMLTSNGNAGLAELALDSAFGFGSTGLGSLNGQRVRYESSDLPNAAEFTIGITELERDNTGQVLVTARASEGTASVTLRGYEDPVLAQR